MTSRVRQRAAADGDDETDAGRARPTCCCPGRFVRETTCFQLRFSSDPIQEQNRDDFININMKILNTATITVQLLSVSRANNTRKKNDASKKPDEPDLKPIDARPVRRRFISVVLNLVRIRVALIRNKRRQRTRVSPTSKYHTFV